MQAGATPVTDADRKHYQEEGYVLLRGVLPHSLIDDCRGLLSQWVEEMARAWHDKGLLDDLCEDLGFEDRFYALWQQAGKPNHERSPRGTLVRLDPRACFDILGHPALLDAAEGLLETREIASHAIWNSRPKAPSARFTDTPLHQDAQYYRDQAGTGIVSAWFPLHDVDERRSCLAVSPGYRSDHVYTADEGSGTGFIGIAGDAARELPQRPIPMQAGDLLCFNEFTPHGALPNQTDKMRWSMDVRFVDADRAHPDATSLGFVARSRDPQRVESYEQWLEKWKDHSGY